MIGMSPFWIRGSTSAPANEYSISWSLSTPDRYTNRTVFLTLSMLETLVLSVMATQGVDTASVISIPPKYTIARDPVQLAVLQSDAWISPAGCLRYKHSRIAYPGIRESYPHRSS